MTFNDKTSPLENLFADIQFAEDIDITYLIKQIELLAAVCSTRNFICIDALSPYISMDVLFIYLCNPNLSIEIRAALARLIMTMFIDIAPL